MTFKKYILAVFLLTVLISSQLFCADVYYNFQRAAGATTNGTSWVNAFISITNANQGAAGDTNWIAFCHNETHAAAVSLSLVGVGTVAAPCYFICSDTNSMPPTTQTNSAVVWTKTTGSITLSAGYDYWDGISMFAGTGASTASIILNGNVDGWAHKFVNCYLAITNTATASRLTLGQTGSPRDFLVTLINTPVAFGVTNQGFGLASAQVEWLNTANAVQGVVPSNLIIPTVAGYGTMSLRGVDLSALNASTKAIFGVGAGNDASAMLTLTDCKLGANVAMATGTLSGPGADRMRMVNSDSADTNYRFYKLQFEGEEFQETTITRTGGATDGTTPYSRKLVASSNARYIWPLNSEWISGWNDTTGTPITLGVEIVTDGVTNKNNEVWLETECMTTTSLGVFKNNSNTNLVMAGAFQPLSSKVWTTSGLSSPITQTLSVTVTPTQKGWLRARVMNAATSRTVYYDPIFTNGFSKSYMSGADGIIATPTPAASGGSFTFSQ
jgi:hypothetical protein